MDARAILNVNVARDITEGKIGQVFSVFPALCVTSTQIQTIRVRQVPQMIQSSALATRDIMEMEPTARRARRATRTP